MASKTRILVGASVRCEQHLFDAYYRSLRALLAPKNCEVSYAFVDDSGGTLTYPEDCLVLPAPQRPASAEYSVGSDTHHWKVETFEHLARAKQLLLDYAVSEGFAHLFLVDSDLLLEPTTLRSLYACKVEVVSAVFWTQWSPGTPPLPQCWLAHPYELQGLGVATHEYLRALKDKRLVRVLGGGACCLIDTKVLDRLRYHPRLRLPEHGMWQGEDRTFAVLCQQHRVRQYADAWPWVYHAYRPEDRAQANLDKQWELLSAPRQLYAKRGDWVSLRLTPMEDFKLEEALEPTVRNARGRLGARPMAPEIEEAVLDMCPGDRRLVEIAIQDGHPVYPAGTIKTIMVELVDVKPY